MPQYRAKTEDELEREFIQTIIAATESLTYFGPQSANGAMAKAGARIGQYATLTQSQMLRRLTLQAASGAYLDQVLQEQGAEGRRGEVHARMLVVLSPRTTSVTAITVGATDLIEVEDSTDFQGGDSIRIRSADGSDTEIATIIAVTAGTGPGGGDELEVATLTNTYAPGSEEVTVLFRATVPLEHTFTTEAGVNFQALTAVVTGDANPVLNGEATELSLADKVWCEATTPGADGLVDPGTVTGLSPSIRGIVAANNPEGARYGEDQESDFAAKRRAATLATSGSQETISWIEALLQRADADVLRAFRADTTSVGTMNVVALHRTGASFTSSRLTSMEGYVEDRVRSYLSVSVSNLALTSIEVKATFSLVTGYTLRQVFIDMAARLAAFLDLRKWEEGAAVDESDLLVICKQTPGVGALETDTFEPTADVSVDYLPTLVRLHVVDADSGDEINATLVQTY